MVRRFFSYGPVDCKYHFCVKRSELVEQCFEQLIDIPDKGGHYFTIWAPRQTGKTWLMRQVKQEISRRYPDQFVVFNFSLGNLRGLQDREWDSAKLPESLSDLLENELPGKPEVRTWKAFSQLFSKANGLWDKPLILLIDEADTAPPSLLDLIVGRFRELYLSRENNRLHGLALIGVRAILGLDSRRGSPFNIQKSLHVPNFTLAEVEELYRQYQEESGQKIKPAVVEKVYQATRGQPGLVSWLGELLSEKYNPGQNQIIGLDTWELVWNMARFIEPNNTVMNLIAKARMTEYQGFLMELFTRPDMPFSFHTPIHNYLYLHGIVEPETIQQPDGRFVNICRFTSPFIQESLYYALSNELVGDSTPILALEPLDDLADVFNPAPQGTTEGGLDLPALLRRYKDYLARLKAKGINPWKEQPRRKTDLHLTEAVGHFHLYAWLQAAVGRQCVVSPEFPTGNGKVDLHLRCKDKQGVIEVKSFVDAYQATQDRMQAARYAKSLGLEKVTVAMFVPLDDETILEKLSVKEVRQGIQVTVVAIGWV